MKNIRPIQTVGKKQFRIIEKSDVAAMIQFNNCRYALLSFNTMFADGYLHMTKSEYDYNCTDKELTDLQWTVSSYRNELKPATMPQQKLIDYIKKLPK